MSSRIIAAGLFSCLLGAAVLTVAPGAAQAAGVGAWSGYAGQSKRPQFRPWPSRVEQRAVDTRWRPHRSTGPQIVTTRYAAAPPRQAAPLIAPEPRYTPPATRAFARSVNVGVRFRPNGRGSVTPVDRVQSTSAVTAADQALQSQFRPKADRKRLSYEELQARSGSTRQRAWAPTTAQPAYGPSASVALAPVAGFPPYWGSW